jgi:hypothetical protein
MDKRIAAVRSTRLALEWIKLRVGLYPHWTAAEVDALHEDLKAACTACGQDVAAMLKTVGAGLDEAQPALAERVRRAIDSESGAQRYTLMKQA